MDAAHTLIRLTTRSFYSTKHVLLIDALIIHSVLAPDDFAHLLGQPVKEVRKLLAPLKNARLLGTHSRQEARGDGPQKVFSREYYYIPLHPAIDAVKFKVWKLQQKVQELYKPDEERKEWKCPRCGSEWTELEVLDSVGPMGFECHRCGGPLDRAENGKGDTAAMAGHEKQARLMAQIDKMLKLMRQIDNLEIPENDFDSAWERKKDVPREDGVGTRRPNVAVDRIGFARSGNGQIEHTDASKVSINLSTGDELNEAERLEAEKQKKAIAAQNQLPIWHLASAIGLDSDVKTENSAMGAILNGEMKSDPDKETKPVVTSVDDDLAAMYAEMERERERDAERAAMAAQDAEDDEDEEDSEDDFEDVTSTTAGTPLPGGTPLLSQSSQTAATNGVKREREMDQGFESGTSTSVNTPAEAATPSSKRAKLENGTPDGVTVEAGPSTAAVKQEEGSDSDEDEGDFEDAM